MSFWDVVWFIFISFAFVAYLMVMFSIIADLFRDRETSGWLEGGLDHRPDLLPALTALVYLIARGRGMAERSMQQRSGAAKRQQDAYIKEVAGHASPATRSPRPGRCSTPARSRRRSTTR